MNKELMTKESGRDIALKVCRIIYGAHGTVGKLGQHDIVALAHEALRLEGIRAAKQAEVREKAARQARSWEREARRKANATRARKSRVGRLLALRNRVVKFLRELGVEPDFDKGYNLSVTMDSRGVCVQIEKMLSDERRPRKVDIRRDAKQYAIDLKTMMKVKDEFGGHLTSVVVKDCEYPIRTRVTTLRMLGLA